MNSENNFSSYKFSNSSFQVISVNLKRAVIEYVEEFKQYLNNRQNDHDNDIIIDFTNTNFIDSSFLGAIISLLKKIKISNGRLRLVVDSKKIIFFLPIKNISKVIDIYPTVDEAVSNINRLSLVNR